VKRITILVEDTDQATDICRMLSHAEAVGELDFSFNVSVTDTEPDEDEEPQVVISWDKEQFFEEGEVTDEEWAECCAKANDITGQMWEDVAFTIETHLKEMREEKEVLS
jgi:tryptophanyl-tRNA synthetase